jgi:hypothetical protein
LLFLTHFVRILHYFGGKRKHGGSVYALCGRTVPRGTNGSVGLLGSAARGPRSEGSTCPRCWPRPNAAARRQARMQPRRIVSCGQSWHKLPAIMSRSHLSLALRLLQLTDINTLLLHCLHGQARIPPTDGSKLAARPVHCISMASGLWQHSTVPVLACMAGYTYDLSLSFAR